MGKLILDGTKLPYHLDRVKAWLDGERIAPITVEWSLSRRCTYRCKYDNYCYTENERTSKDVITKDIAFRFLRDCAKIGVKAVPLGCDGESTCNPILYDVIPYAKEVGLDIAMSTNGYLLRHDKLEQILPNLSYLRFNFSAGEPDKYAYIMGCHSNCFYTVCETIKKCVKIKKAQGLKVTIGLQLVLLPQFGHQIIPMAKLGKELGVDYLVIKHCSDDRIRGIGIDFNKYAELTPLLKEAESYSNEKYLVKVKWSKISSGGKQKYTYCYGPQFLQQISASGSVGPCGTFFHENGKQFNVGNIADTPFKDIVKSEKYWKVMNHLGSDKFHNSSCWSMCFQHKLNEFLWDLKRKVITLDEIKPKGDEIPEHVNFV